MSTTTPNLDVLTIDEAAALLGCERALVERRMSDGSLPFVEGIRRKRAIRLLPRVAVEAYQAQQRTRMSAREAFEALGFKSYEGLRGLVERGDLKAVLVGGRPTYDRTEVQRLAAQRAQHLPLQQAADRAGIHRVVLRRWIEKTGGTVRHREGARARFALADVDNVRQHIVPDGSIDVTEAAKLLGVSVVEARKRARSGDLPSLVQPQGPKGWRFDRTAVLQHKNQRERVAMRSVLDRWSTPATLNGGVERSNGRTVHRARHIEPDRLDVMALSAAWQAW